MAQRDIELGIGATIERGGSDDLVAGSEQGSTRAMNWAACPEATASAPTPSFERGHPLLERGGGRIHDPGVDVAKSLECKKFGSMVGIFENIRGRLVERHRPGASGRIGSLTGMNAIVLKPNARSSSDRCSGLASSLVVGCSEGSCMKRLSTDTGRDGRSSSLHHKARPLAPTARSNRKGDDRKPVIPSGCDRGVTRPRSCRASTDAAGSNTERRRLLQTYG